jgi:hypothetical protein
MICSPVSLLKLGGDGRRLEPVRVVVVVIVSAATSVEPVGVTSSGVGIFIGRCSGTEPRSKLPHRPRLQSDSLSFIPC